MSYQYNRINESEEDIRNRNECATQCYGFLAIVTLLGGLVIASVDCERSKEEYLRNANNSIQYRTEEQINDNVGSFIGRSPPPRTSP